MSESDPRTRSEPLALRSHPIAIPISESYGRPLTGRQLQVLILSARGLSQTQIAAELGVSHNTVVGHKRLLKERLGASSTVDAIAIGIETGVIETDPGLDSIDSSRFDTLTPRQRVVYELLVEDYGHPTYDELAHRLGITEQGVKNAAVKIFRKLGLRDRKQAIELELKQRQGLSGEFDEAL